jgi:hypothetical protein
MFGPVTQRANIKVKANTGMLTETRITTSKAIWRFCRSVISRERMLAIFRPLEAAVGLTTGGRSTVCLCGMLDVV